MIYKATIEVFVDADSEAEACDAISETLRPFLRKFSPQSCFVDWRYTQASQDGTYLYPVHASDREIAELEC